MKNRKAARQPAQPVQCEALRIAQLIGQYFDLNDQLDDSKRSATDGASRGKFERGSMSAFRMCYVARNALALAPVSSLPGAFAKLIAGIGAMEDALEAENDPDKEDSLHLAYALIEGALSWFETACGITPASVGAEAFFNVNALPLRRINDARRAGA